MLSSSTIIIIFLFLLLFCVLFLFLINNGNDYAWYVGRYRSDIFVLTSTSISVTVASSELYREVNHAFCFHCPPLYSLPTSRRRRRRSNAAAQNTKGANTTLCNISYQTIWNNKKQKTKKKKKKSIALHCRRRTIILMRC